MTDDRDRRAAEEFAEQWPAWSPHHAAAHIEALTAFRAAARAEGAAEAIEGAAKECDRETERHATSGVARLIEAARAIRDLGEWSATEDGDLVLTCPDGSTEISYLANRAAVVARALTALAEVDLAARDAEIAKARGLIERAGNGLGAESARRCDDLCPCWRCKLVADIRAYLGGGT